MIEARQDFALHVEAAQDEIRVHPAAHQLDGGRLTESALGPLAEIDGAHAALSELADDPPGSDPLGRGGLGTRVRERDLFGGGHLEKRAGRVGGREQRSDVGGELRVTAALAAQQPLAVLDRGIRDAIEDAAHLLPTVGGHDSSSSR